MNKTFITTGDNKPEIQYIGLWNVLDILSIKIYESKDYEECSGYCRLYKMMYELLGSDE